MITATQTKSAELTPVVTEKTGIALVQILNNAQALHHYYSSDGEKNEAEVERRVRNFMYYLSSLLVNSYPRNDGDLEPVLEGLDELEKALHANLKSHT